MGGREIGGGHAGLIRIGEEPETGRARTRHPRQLRIRIAQRRKAAFAVEPTGPNQVWQLDFSEFETTTGGTWRIAGCRDYWSKYEHPFHVSPTANQFDEIDAAELALADNEERKSVV